MDVSGRIAGVFLFIAGAIMYGLIHSGFHSLLDETIETGVQTPIFAIIVLLFIVVVGSAIGLWSSSEAYFKSLCYSLSLARAVRRTQS